MLETSPSHVPAELLVDFDMSDIPNSQQDMQSAWHRELAGRPLVYTPKHGGYWIVTQADDLELFYRDTARLSNYNVFLPAHEGERVLPGELDGQRHSEMRKGLQAVFNKEVVERLEPRIREITIDLVEKLKPRGECEFIHEFGLVLPVIVFLGFAGLPLTDRDELQGYANVIARGPTAEARNVGHHGLQGYVRRLVELRRGSPSDDLISNLLSIRVNDEPLTDAEAIGLCTGIMLGGLDTTASALGFIAHFLAGSPEFRQKIRQHPELNRHTVEEMLRRFSVVSLGRTVINDYEYKGVFLKHGDRVLLPTFLHGLDANKFESPTVVDFNRRSRHLAFGSGPHMCPGSFLARSELRLFLEEWVTRIPEFEVDPTDTFKIASGQVLSFNRLRLRWPVQN